MRVGRRLQDRPAARYFAEKLRPDFVPELMREIYPGAREVILVRDFRDMVSSMFAFNAKRGFEGFRRGAAGSDAEFIADRVGGVRRGTGAGAGARAPSGAHLVRYEDLVPRPAGRSRALLGYLGLDSSGAALDAMVASVTARGDESDGHRTVRDPARLDRALAHRPLARPPERLRGGARPGAALDSDTRRSVAHGDRRAVRVGAPAQDGRQRDAELFRLFPEVIVFADLDHTNDKHALFSDRADAGRRARCSR